VELFEKTSGIGGKIVPGGMPKIKYEIENYRMYLNRLLKEAEETGNLKVHFNAEVSAESIKKKGFDSIVFAVGTTSGTPKIPGIEKAKTVQATDLLCDVGLIGDAKKIVVVGGGVVGCETAYWLKYEHGRDVTVVEMLPHMMDGACTANRGHLIHYMRKAGVALLNCAKVKEFGENSVVVTRNVSAGVPDAYNTWQPILPKNIENPLARKLGPEEKEETLAADYVVLAMGGRPDDAIFYEAQRIHAAPELHNIGDSFASGRVLEATRAANALASAI